MMVSGSQCSSRVTAAGFPEKGVDVKAFTVMRGNFMGRDGFCVATINWVLGKIGNAVGASMIAPAGRDAWIAAND